MNAPFNPFSIAGAGGGKGGGGGSEKANTLKSRQTAKIVDLLSEGPIRGVVGGAKGVYYDGVALRNADGTYNFSDSIVQFVNGYPDQPIMKGFSAQQTETQVGQQVLFDIPLVRSILNLESDRARVTVSVPSLQKADNKGNIKGSKVEFRIEVQNDGGGYQSLGDFEISGKTSSRYQRAISFGLPAPGPWDIRVTRLTADSTSSKLQNDLYWDTYTALIDDRVNYTLSACVGTIIDAKQFNSIPKRTFLTDGILVRIPDNYDPDAATYDGVWTGNFVTDWTNNPAWVLYDLAVNNRYGIGEFITAAQIDKWALYKIGQWCDELISNGKGGQERRFTCDIQIMDQQQAFDLLNQIASVFRGAMYWAGGQLIATADMPSDPVAQFTNANVIDGRFDYRGSDIRAHHTMAQVGWNDPNALGQPRIANVEAEPGAISRFGIQKVDIAAVGCTRESQAIRTGNWQLYTEQYEGETVTLQTGLIGAYVNPGAIFQASDILVGGERRGGRVGAGTTAARVVFDAPTTQPAPGAMLAITCEVGDGVLQTIPATSIEPDGMAVTPFQPFSSAPLPDTVWVLSEIDNLEPTLWRTVGIKQNDRDKYEITGVRHFPGKWDYVENHIPFAEPDVSNISVIPKLPTNLTLIEYLMPTSTISVGVMGTLSWISDAPQFDVGYRAVDDNWEFIRTDQKAIDFPLTEGDWEFSVTPISAVGLKGPVARLTQEISGRFPPPSPPLNFRVTVTESVALFEWTPSTEMDVKIGGHFELRHTYDTGTGSTWITAQPVIPTIPGTASSVTTTYRVGTWFLRTYDSIGQPSPTWSTIIALDPDERYTQYARICESPDWNGTFDRTTVQMPEEWLTLALTDGGAGPPETYGEYIFANRIDAGGVFPIRFSTEILAFAFEYPDSFFDSRLDNADDWADWDSAADDLDGQIQLQIRTTDDNPTSGTPVWSGWQQFNGGTYTARAFEFKAILTAPEGQNIGVEQLCIVADFREKIDHDDDVVYTAADKTVTFDVNFFLVPAIVITIQNAVAGDVAQIITKTRDDFKVRITNGGSQVNRTFDWHAMGY